MKSRLRAEDGLIYWRRSEEASCSVELQNLEECFDIAQDKLATKLNSSNAVGYIKK